MTRRGARLADTAANTIERGGVHQQPGMARRALACLPFASVGRLLVCSPRQLCTRGPTRPAHRSVVLPSGPSNVQPAAGLPRRQAARFTGLGRRERQRSGLGQEHGSCCRPAARVRCDLAQRGALAESSRSSGPGRAQRRITRGAGDTDRRCRQGCSATDRSWAGAFAAPASSLSLVTVPEQPAGATGVPVTTARWTAS